MFQNNSNITTRPTAAIKVAKLVLQATGMYNPMYSRPYQTHMDGSTMDNIVRRVNDSNGGTISGTLLAGVASNILTPTAVHKGEIPIPMGWTERRIRFLMEVHVALPTGSSFVYYFQGYTNYLGVTDTGSIDPRMEFIINSYLRVNRASQMTPYGLQTTDVVTESAHVINGQIYQQSINMHDAYGMRPQDIFAGIQSAYLSSSYAGHHQGDGFTDTRICIGNDSIRSGRSNNLACNYVAKVVDGFQTAKALLDFGQGEHDVYSRAHSTTYESPLQENVFIRQLSNVKGMPNATTFTIGDLMRIDPNAGNVIDYLHLGQTAVMQLHQVGQSAYWNQPDAETLAATILSNAVPAVMMDLMIRKISFTATNHDATGMANIMILHANSLSTANLSSNFDLFKARLEREVLFDLTYGNSELYMLTMTADLFGDTTISISLGSGPMITYNTPSFCDGLITPVVTGDSQALYGIVNDFEMLMNQLGDKTSMAVNTSI